MGAGESDTGWTSTPEPDPTSTWLAGPALAEMLYLEVLWSIGSSVCPRCNGWRFTYAALGFCTFGCPENMVTAEESG